MWPHTFYFCPFTFYFPPVKLYPQDIKNFLSKLTLRRILNLVKLYSSYYLTKWTGKPIQWGMPMTISIEPTTACNLHCPECPSGLRSFTRPTGNLKSDFSRLRSIRLQMICFISFFIFRESLISILSFWTW